MLTEKDYCYFDTCVALKEIGYNEKSNWWFNKFLNADSGQMEFVRICDNLAHLNYDSWGIVPKDFIIRPSLYDAQKWLREEKRIHIVLTYYSQIGWYEYSVKKDDNLIAEGSAFPTYEEALSTAIYMAVEYLKEEK